MPNTHEKITNMTEFPYLAHYTTYQGLLGILATKQLWATHYRFLNDYSETEHGKKLIDQIYREAVESSDSLIEKKRKRYLGDPESLRVSWWKGISPQGNDPEFFFTSFSGIPDNSSDEKTRLGTDGSLSQWRAYGDNGGFAIVFEISELDKSYKSFSKKCKDHLGWKNESTCPDCKIYFFENLLSSVYYNRDLLIKDEPIAYEAMKKCAEKLILIDTGDQLRDFFEKNEEIVNNNIRGIIGVLGILKHPGFHEENEIRFTCLNRLEKSKGGYYNKSPYEITLENKRPTLKIDFLPSTIKKIIIGPQLNQDELKILIKHHLEANKYENIEIIKSGIPFRSVQRTY